MSESTTVDPDNKVAIFWDDSHIEGEAEHFPRELRDLYRQTKIFCRDQLGKDMDRVTEAFAKVGAKRDKTTWSRIFKRGRWNHNSSGDPLPSPLVSAQKLKEEFESLITQTRVELRRGKMPFVETAVWNLIRRFVAKKMRPEWVNKFGVITGPTGLQKSASFRELALRDPNIKHVECIDGGSFTQMITLIALKYGISINRNNGEKRFKIYENFGPDKCLIVDNTQDFQNSPEEIEELQRAMKFFRWLQDERGGTIIWSITPQSEDAIFPKESIFMEQFEGRAGGKEGFLRLANQNPVGDLVLIAEMLGMKNAEKHADRLKQIGTMRGRIRTYFEILQEAKLSADAAKKPLSIEFIDDALEERVPAKEGK
ncbi:MAG: ATP-binding protein [Verrucomicrobiae bacterium]|nr:ATP-binding protein [Verrucomicrobiae bacterium]